VIENERCQTSEMPKVWKTFGLCNRVCKRFTGLTATPSKREANCYLHGMLPEEKIEESQLTSLINISFGFFKTLCYNL